MNELFSRTLILLALLALMAGPAPAWAQDEAGGTSGDATYYDFWPGDWHEVVDGEVADQPRFQVERGLHPHSFEEEWHMEGYEAKAWRVWDSTTDRWMFIWISEDGHFQIWKEEKIGDHWYMFKEFVVDGEPVLSRQAFIPQDDGTLVRTSEHSSDGGETWTLRFKEVLVKVSRDGPET